MFLDLRIAKLYCPPSMIIGEGDGDCGIGLFWLCGNVLVFRFLRPKQELDVRLTES